MLRKNKSKYIWYIEYIGKYKTVDDDLEAHKTMLCKVAYKAVNEMGKQTL